MTVIDGGRRAFVLENKFFIRQKGFIPYDHDKYNSIFLGHYQSFVFLFQFPDDPF